MVFGPRFQAQAEIVEFDPALRVSWQDGGAWPHANLYHFYEAIVATHFILHGYQVVRDYVATRTTGARPATTAGCQLFHAIIGPEISRFMTEELDQISLAGRGQPDLFVFREDSSHDAGIHFPDPRLWFFVEVKGPGDQVRDSQRQFWRAVALRDDIGLGPERIRLVKAIPSGAGAESNTIEY